MASLWRPLRPQGAKTAPTASLRVLASSFPTNLTTSRGTDKKKSFSCFARQEATSLFLILPSRSMSSTSSMKRPSAATSVRNGQRRPHIINYHQHNQVPPRNGEEMSNLAPTPRDLFPAPPAFEALAHRVTQAVQAKDLPAAMTHLRQLDALYLPSPPSSPISSSVRLLISGTAYAVLHLCLAERKRTEGEKGIEEALDVLTMPNLATSYDKACTRIAFTTLPITDTSSWPTTMAFFRNVLTYLTPAAWPAPHQFHRALRQLADAGQPTQCQWLLDRMRRPQALAPPHEEGKEDRRQPSFLPPPPIPIGSAGQLHSPRWHLLKSYLYSHQPLQAVRLLQTEKNLRLDCNTTNMVLKGLARERLGQDALNFLKWAEEVGVKTTTESYNKVIIALAKTNRSFHPYASSSSFQRFPHPCPPSADKDGHAISAPTAAVDAEADAASPMDTTAAAREVLARMNAKEILPDHVSYCALLDVYAEANDVKGAVAMFFGEMCQVGREGGGEGGKSGIMPTDVAFGTLMKAFARVGEWRKVLMCVEGMHELGITDEREVCYALAAYACGKAGRWREVVGLVDGLKEREGGVRTLKTYIFAMHTCGKAGRYGEARRLLEEVQGRGDLMEGMDAYAYNLAMHICARNGDQGGALRWWGMMKEARRERGLDNFNVGALLTAFGAEGQWEEGLAFVEEVVLSTGRPVPDAALALLALRAAKAGRGEEVVERVLELLSKHQQSIPSFLHGAMCLALAESGQYAKGLGMALAEAPRKEQLRSAGMGEEEWREKVKEKEEGEEGEESMDDYVRTQLAFVQLKQTPWPVAWCLVDGLEAQGLLHSTAVEVATEALARKDGYELFACGLERHRGRAWREAEVVADESSSDAHISSSRSLNEEGANSQEEDEEERSNDEEEAVRWAMVLNPRAAPIPSRSSPSSPSSCSMSYIDRHHSRHAEHGWAAAAAAAFSSFSGPWR